MSGWLQTKFPGLDVFSHDSGHLWSTLMGEKGDPHFGVLHIASYIFLGYGFYLLSSSWMFCITLKDAKSWRLQGLMPGFVTLSMLPL